MPTATLSHDRRTGELTLTVTRADGTLVEITSQSEDRLRRLAARQGIRLAGQGAANRETARKRNAANTPALARVKRLFNAKVYQNTLRAWNTGGEAAAREYVGRLYRDECRAERLAALFDGE